MWLHEAVGHDDPKTSPVTIHRVCDKGKRANFYDCCLLSLTLMSKYHVKDHCIFNSTGQAGTKCLQVKKNGFTQKIDGPASQPLNAS